MNNSGQNPNTLGQEVIKENPDYNPPNPFAQVLERMNSEQPRQNERGPVPMADLPRHQEIFSSLAEKDKAKTAAEIQMVRKELAEVTKQLTSTESQGITNDNLNQHLEVTPIRNAGVGELFYLNALLTAAKTNVRRGGDWLTIRNAGKGKKDGHHETTKVQGLNKHENNSGYNAGG